MSIWVFLLAVLDFATDLVPFLVAIGLATLIRNRLDMALAIANLCLLMELATTVVDQEHRFASLAAPRLLAAALHMVVARKLVLRWRRRHRRVHSVVAH
jgi:hypothetical protein